MQLPDIEPLLRLSFSDMRTWLSQVTAREIPVPTEYNWWLGLAQALANRVDFNTTLSQAERLQWASVTITLYQYLAITLPYEQRFSPESSAMALRVRLIDQLGAKAGHPVLDPIIVERWVLDNLPLTLEEAEKYLVRFDPSATVPIQAFHDIKRRVQFLEWLNPKGHIADHEAARRWFHICELFLSKLRGQSS